jgi:putative ABC transport system permease protein
VPRSFPPLPLRNLWRNPRRTLLCAGAVFVAVASILVLDGLAEGAARLLEDGFIQEESGAVQVHRRGFLEGGAMPQKLLMPPAAQQRAAGVPGVRAVAPRLVFEAMVSDGRSFTAARIAGVDSEAEDRVCPLRWHASGTRLPQRGPAAVVGHVLARGLGVSAGAGLTLVATTVRGTQNALDVEMAAAGRYLDPRSSKRLVALTLPEAERLVGSEGANELAIAIDPGAGAEAVAAALRAALGPDYEIHTWEQLAPQAALVVRQLRGALELISIVLALLVAGTIANIMLVVVSERTREIGTLRALGLTRRGVLALLLAESAWLGTLAALAGALAAHALCAAVRALGPAVVMPGTQASVAIRPALGPGMTAAAVGAALVCALAAGAGPAWAAARLTPAEALRR